MSSGKEIRNKIKSVQNTQKITRAMQMVATSKMRKTQIQMRSARPYAENIRRVVAHLTQVNAAAKNIIPFLRSPMVLKRVGIVFITSDKGLCGGLNMNATKVFLEKVNALKKDEVAVQICAIGHKGLHVAKRLDLDVVSTAIGLGDIPKMEQLVGPLRGLLQKFHEGDLDAIYVIYSKFVNTMTQKAVIEQLLPLEEQKLEDSSSFLPWDYLYEPSALDVVDELIKRYLESVVFQCLADNMASEQAARMVAMKSATDNAGNAINRLKLIYNKTRQTAITTELAEIVSGAAAV